MSRLFSLVVLSCFFACSPSTEGNGNDKELEPGTGQTNAQDTTIEKPQDCPSTLTIGFYNLENLFDTQDDPATQDEDFLPGSKKAWKEDRYQDKLKKLAEVLSKIGEADSKGPEVFGMCEAENRSVIEELLKTGDLEARGYELVHFESPDTRGIDVALAYDPNVFSPTSKKAFEVDFRGIAVQEFRNTITRNFLLVTGELCGEPTGFIVNHWPSRRGGTDFSSAKREFVAKHVRRVVDSLQENHPELNLILVGDFNDTPFDKSVSQVLGADTSGGYLYNTVAYLQAKGIGSHYWHDERSMLDQLIVNKKLRDQKGWDYVSFSAKRFAPEWLKQDESNGKYAGFPNRTYAGNRYLGGYSDHFPVYLKLKKHE